MQRYCLGRGVAAGSSFKRKNQSAEKSKWRERVFFQDSGELHGQDTHDAKCQEKKGRVIGQGTKTGCTVQCALQDTTGESQCHTRGRERREGGNAGGRERNFGWEGKGEEQHNKSKGVHPSRRGRSGGPAHNLCDPIRLLLLNLQCLPHKENEKSSIH